MRRGLGGGCFLMIRGIGGKEGGCRGRSVPGQMPLLVLLLLLLLLLLV